MAQDTQVTLCGYVAKEPMFKTLESGASFAKFRMAFTERRRDRRTGEWSDGATTFLGVKCFRRLAENVAGSLRKGEPVMVSGRMYTHEYTGADGQKRSELQVDASSIGHDLNRGVAIFSRTRKAAGGTALESAAAVASADAAEADDYGSEDAAAGSLDPLDAAGAAGTEAGAAAEAGTAAGGVVDESAVAEFARQLDESLPGAPDAPLADGEDAATADGEDAATADGQDPASAGGNDGAPAERQDAATADGKDTARTKRQKVRAG